METETRDRAAVVLQDSLTIPGAVSINRPDARGKARAIDVVTRGELQAIVQQAYDRYGILADPLLGAEWDPNELFRGVDL